MMNLEATNRADSATTTPVGSGVVAETDAGVQAGWFPHYYSITPLFHPSHAPAVGHRLTNASISSTLPQ
jgi:hypothetical protein